METKKTFLSVGKGFTLIELLITVAIIGILASVILASLSNARQRSKDASVFSSVTSADKVAMVCSSSLLNINNPPNPYAVVAVCTGMDNYADISANSSSWSYGNYAGCTQDMTASDGNFTICAKYGTTKGIKCTQNGCTKVGF